MNRVLFVDDEPNVLRSIACSLRGRRGDWDMQFAAVTEAFVYRERRITAALPPPPPSPPTAEDGDLRRMVLTMATTLTCNGMLDLAEAPESLREAYLKSVDPAALAPLSGPDAPTDEAPAPEPALDDLRRRLGIVTGDGDRHGG